MGSKCECRKQAYSFKPLQGRNQICYLKTEAVIKGATKYARWHKFKSNYYSLYLSLVSHFTLKPSTNEPSKSSDRLFQSKWFWVKLVSLWSAHFEAPRNVLNSRGHTH